MELKENKINYQSFSEKYKNVLITGGLGFIGSSLILRLLKDTNITVHNIDKSSYDKNFPSHNYNFQKAGFNRYKFYNIDISNKKNLDGIFEIIKPDIVFHLAAESHVDRSIESPKSFIDSNIVGTFNMLENSLSYFDNLKDTRKNNFRFQHISTDEVYGELGMLGSFNEDSNYSPRSPYSASKAASDHLVSAWFHTYGLPTLISNCSNNFGPRQFPDKLIPNVILNAINGSPIPIYGKGLNIRDWLYVEDHVDALILMSMKSRIGENFCIGGNNEKTNIEICHEICNLLDLVKPKENSYTSQIKFVKDRPGHDFRYSINSTKILNYIGWKPRHSYQDSLKETVFWYLENLSWVEYIKKESGYKGERLGNLKKNNV